MKEEIGEEEEEERGGSAGRVLAMERHRLLCSLSPAVISVATRIL